MKRLESSVLEHRPLRQEDADALYRNHPDVPRSHLAGCPACGKNNGYGVDGTVALTDGVWRCNCRDQLQRHKHYLDAGIGETYHYLCWDDFNGDPGAGGFVRGYCDDLKSNVYAGRGIYLHSLMCGTGKTFMAAMVAKASVMAGYPTYMTTFADMCASLKAGWRDAEFDAWYRRKVDGARVLVVDDLGKEMMSVQGFGNSFAAQTFDSLLRTRAQQGRVTVVTSNMDLDGLAAGYGQPCRSLVRECMVDVPVGGEDYRERRQPRYVGNRRVW